MSNYNKVILIGNLTRDPELRYTPKGSAIATLGLAINRQWTTEGGEKREEVCFADCTAFGRTAENAAQYLKKGRSVMVDGRLRTEQWEDKQTGQKRSKLSVVIDSLQFLGGRNEASPEKPDAGRDGLMPAREQQPLRGIDPADVPPPVDNSDDVPF